MKSKGTNFNPIKVLGMLVFLMAFTLNIQTSLDGEWELVNVSFAQGSGSSGSGGSFPDIPDQPGIHCRCHNDGVCYGGNQFSLRKLCHYSDTGTANCNSYNSNCPPGS